MTYSYSDKCSTVKNVGNFWHLLFIWKASVYKILWVDLSIFLFLYYSMGVAYNFLLEGRARQIFEDVCYYCASQMSFIPLSFVLGFYVSNVISRWETQFKALPVGDYIAIDVSANIRGVDDEARLIRRTIMRYVNASFIMLMMVICSPVRKRFPSFDHLVVAGFTLYALSIRLRAYEGMLLDGEKRALESIHDKIPTYNIYWVPLVWAVNLVCKARQQNKIVGDSQALEIIRRINSFRSDCGLLHTYDWISIPLIYTQVVTLAVYTFFLAAILGRQVLEKHSDNDHGHRPIDIYFPIFTILQFMFYMGWLKVAEILVNPFGDDDDDFEINWMIDRNIQMGFAIVDEVPMNIPTLVKDRFWDMVIPDVLPYTHEADIKHDQAPIVLDPKNQVYEESSETRSRGAHNKSTATMQSRKIGFVFPTYQKVENYWQNIFASTFPSGKNFFEKYYDKNKAAKQQQDIEQRQFSRLILESNIVLKDTIQEENDV